MRNKVVWMVCSAGLLLLAADAAFAKDSARSAFAEAKSLAAKGDSLAAAAKYGAALALAQAAGDLQTERAIADSLATWYDALPPDAAKPRGDGGKEGGGPTTDRPSRASILAEVMSELDPKRCGAIVSAPVLAREIVQLATATGDFVFADEAAVVAEAHRKKPGSGAAAAAVADYAAGVAAAAAGDPAKAAVFLESAAVAASGQDWAELAMHAATELAAAHVALGAPNHALEAITKTAAALGPAAGAETVSRWSVMLASRLPAIEGIHEPVSKLLERAAKHPAPGGTGARGADGRDAGAKSGSKVAALLPKLGKGKPLVQAKRTPDGWDFLWITKKERAPVPLTSGHEYVDDGGVWCGVSGRSAALLLVDLAGSEGGFTGRFVPSPVRAFALVGDGETWTVSKEGVVTIGK